MELFQSGVSVRKRTERGRTIISVDEAIDDDELTDRAKLLAAGGTSTGSTADMKHELAEKSVLEAVKREAPEAFDPDTPATIRLNSDHDVELFQ